MKKLGLTLLLGACAHKIIPITHFSKDGATQQQFMIDRYACIKEAQKSVSSSLINTNSYGGYGSSHSNVVTDRGMFMGCITARGYMPDPNGPLYPPAEAVVLMQ